MGDVFDDMETAVDAALLASVHDAAETIATEARNDHPYTDHPYTDRTDTLAESIEALPAVASGEGRVVGGVAAGAPYASFLERRQEFAFLQPAADRSEPRVEHDLDTNLRRGIGRIS